MLFAGYFRKVGDIPWAFRWITYISPFRWAYEGLLLRRGQGKCLSKYLLFNAATIINELGGETFKCKSDELLPPTNAPGILLFFFVCFKCFFSIFFSQGFDDSFADGGYDGNQVCPFTTGDEVLLFSFQFPSPSSNSQLFSTSRAWT